MQNKESILKSIADSDNHVIHLKLPEHLQNLSKKEILIEIENQINYLKEKGVWDDNSNRQ